MVFPRRLCCAALLVLASLLLVTGSACALAVPNYQGYVNDYAKMLSPATRSKLERALQSFELTDSTQVALLTINSLEGDSLEDFSIRTVDQWKIGQKDKDNGVLFLIVKNDRKMRIEVGKGLEGVLTDLASGRIIDAVVAPLFKSGDFEGGIQSGLAAIIQTTRGEFKADQLPRHPTRRGREPSPVLTYLFFGVMIISFFGRVSKPLGIISGALLFPLIGLMGFSSLGFLALLLLVPAGALGGLFLPLLFANAMTGRGGMYMGGGFGGSGGGGGFGGFGGGGFSGGGASGGW